MSRDQRVNDNWALLHALNLASNQKSSCAVVFCIAPGFQGANYRQYDFLLKGLKETGDTLAKLNIPFYLLEGNPPETLSRFVEEKEVGTVVTDFDPLRVKMKWKKEFSDLSSSGLIEVDTHNIVPARIASTKLEFGAYTLRPKINRLLHEFLHEFPSLLPQKNSGPFEIQSINYGEIMNRLNPDSQVPAVSWIIPGENAARGMLRHFIQHKLQGYAVKRNDPNQDALSNLSPYFHFGQLAPQRAALEVQKVAAGNPDAEAFLEELIVRRELADNYCLYNPEYDKLTRIPAWAKATLDAHYRDEREFLYSTEAFEKASTHDPLWNAAQMEMVIKGKMHGYMRMYWAKKILEWTKSPEEAMEIAIYLNDRYQLDGRDPNGYTGIAWSVAGVHDRAWGERPVYGKIRYMNYNGAKKKFDVNAYLRTYTII
jgi:deoxyribodipyrimidine photo-lyase